MPENDLLKEKKENNETLTSKVFKGGSIRGKNDVCWRMFNGYHNDDNILCVD